MTISPEMIRAELARVDADYQEHASPSAERIAEYEAEHPGRSVLFSYGWRLQAAVTAYNMLRAAMHYLADDADRDERAQLDAWAAKVDSDWASASALERAKAALAEPCETRRLDDPKPLPYVEAVASLAPELLPGESLAAYVLRIDGER
jgi:hypothetical protein